jgi:hypothetical protein
VRAFGTNQVNVKANATQSPVSGLVLGEKRAVNCVPISPLPGFAGPTTPLSKWRSGIVCTASAVIR